MAGYRSVQFQGIIQKRHRFLLYPRALESQKEIAVIERNSFQQGF